MTDQHTPEAIEAVAEGIYPEAVDVKWDDVHDCAHLALAFIRDALHRDGDDADAIREALGLRFEGLSYEGGALPSRYRVVGYWMDDEA